MRGTENLTNVITLSKHVHAAWNEFYFALKHIKSDEENDQTLELHFLKPHYTSNSCLMMPKEKFIKAPNLGCDGDGPGSYCVMYD